MIGEHVEQFERVHKTQRHRHAGNKGVLKSIAQVSVQRKVQC